MLNSKISCLVVFNALFFAVCSGRDLKIVNPIRTAKEKEFPYMVSIQQYAPDLKHDVHKCGGFIITAGHVLTAAHCVVNQKLLKDPKYRQIKPQDPRNLSVLAGTIYSYPEFSPEACKPYTYIQNRKIKKIKFPVDIGIHEADPDMFVNDIGLIVLEIGFSITDYVKPLKLIKGLAEDEDVSKQYLYYQGQEQWKNCFLTGWGFQDATFDPKTGYSIGTTKAEALNVMTAKLLDFKICDQYWCTMKKQFCSRSNFRLGDTLCIQGVREGSPCGGDFGSPFVCDGKLIGMLLFLIENNNCGSPLLSGISSGAKIFEFLRQNHLTTSLLYSSAFKLTPHILLIIIIFYFQLMQ